jgi:hypothetical protein
VAELARGACEVLRGYLAASGREFHLQDGGIPEAGCVVSYGKAPRK